MEDPAEDGFSDDDSSKTDDDGTTAHIDICKSLILGTKCTCKCYQSIGDHQTKYDIKIRIDSLRTAHVWITSGRTKRTSEFCSKKPVQDPDDHDTEDRYHKN